MNEAGTRLIRLSPEDNLVVTLADLSPGCKLPREGVDVGGAVPAGHKVATARIAAGEPVRKFGQIIGFASADIEPGDHVHTHNCEFREFARDYAFCADRRGTAAVAPDQRATFSGYRRGDGRAATRNYIGVLSTVNCSATVARQIAQRVEASGILARYPNVDGVVGFGHGAGCAMDPASEGFTHLRRVLHGYARHPNFYAVLIVGLGCEVNQVGPLVDSSGLARGEGLHTLVMQEVGGTRATVEAGVAHIEQLLPRANACRREAIGADELVVALQCGGSDGFSGITANPAMGAAVDRLVAHGGTAILAETPEIYGAEHLLTRRARSTEVGQRLVERIRWWEDYTRLHGSVMDNNPTPGNKAGGLTTILEKSLGAAAKGGTTDLTGVYEYAQPVDTRGFVFMDSPGYDPCSITGQVASGATLVCFSTGRGSSFGCKPSPSLKLATNTTMFRHLEEDMDVNCGVIADGACSVDEMGEIIFREWLAVASGRHTKSEDLGYGDNEFVPWSIGVVM